MNIQDIHYLFTIRYNPTRQVNFLPRPNIDFVPEDTDNSVLEMHIMESIRRITAGKNKVAISLSAGVDSNVVLSLLKEVRPDIKIKCFCMDGDEVEETRRLAGDLPFTVVTRESVMQNISKYVNITAEPRWNVYHHRVAEEVKAQGYDLLLTGDGGDELLAGYVFRYQSLDKDLIRGFPYAHLQGHKNDYLPEQEKFLKGFKWDDIYTYLSQFESSFLTPIESTFAADFNGKFVYDLVPTSKAISKYHKIEIKSPFLSKEIIDYCLSMDTYKKINEDFTLGKLPLREILDKKGVVVSEKKMGFTHDLVKDYNDNRGRPIYLHPRTFDYISYKWYEENSHEDADYRIINKIVQTHCLSEWFKLRDSQGK